MGFVSGRQTSRHVARPGAPAQHGLGGRGPANALSRCADRHLSHPFKKLRRDRLCATLIVRFVTTAPTNVHMHTESKRIEVQFPAIPAAHALISITNRGITAWDRKARDLQDALVLN